MRTTLVCLFLMGCTTVVETDAGGGTDAAVDTSHACVSDYQTCNAYSPPCCDPSYICLGTTGLCEPACEPMNTVCSDNSQCCSGICNGTCQ